MKPDIKSRRLELGLTLEQVGQKVGVRKSTVRKWETGDIENMKRDKISKLADALKVSPSYIMGFDNQAPKTHTKEFEKIIAHIKSDVTKEEMEEIINFIDYVNSKRTNQQNNSDK